MEVLVSITEALLSRRRAKKRILREKARKKNVIIDWIETILWAMGVVLLINQYLFQAYEIPSGSMIDTLEIQDRIFVNKFIYGPELLPGLLKLPGIAEPQRDEVIIFENPAYLSRGTAFDVAQRIIFMLTLSLVDIDRNENGDIQAHFLIKRAVGAGGERFVQVDGNMQIRFAGEDSFIGEAAYNEARGYAHNLPRLASDYPRIEAMAQRAAYQTIGAGIPSTLRSISSPSYNDPFAYEAERLETLRLALPNDARYRSQLYHNQMGWYVPNGYILPLGDNRDNSRDGRYFGPVAKNKVLGQGFFIFWPLNRLGGISN
jgi:signal peptidase I